VGRLLGRHRGALVLMSFMSLGVLIISSAAYCGDFTGYPFGSWTGASGGEDLTVGHFANHSSVHCPNDPASSWAFGTVIVTAEDIAIKDSEGTSHLYNLC
jgi:hypothetical protein